MPINPLTELMKLLSSHKGSSKRRRVAFTMLVLPKFMHPSIGLMRRLLLIKRRSRLIPGDKNVYQELAQLYIQKEDFEAAEKMFQYAIQYTGEEWERQNIERQLMELYRRQGKLEGMLQQAESEGMLSFEMQRQRARDHASQGEWEQAANAYKKAMDMTTQSWERNEVSTELVRIYAQLGQIDTAIDLYKNRIPIRSKWHVYKLGRSNGLPDLLCRR